MQQPEHVELEQAMERSRKSAQEELEFAQVVQRSMHNVQGLVFEQEVQRLMHPDQETPQPMNDIADGLTKGEIALYTFKYRFKSVNGENQNCSICIVDIF